MTKLHYLLRDIDRTLWRRVHLAAEREGQTVRQWVFRAILAALHA